MTHFRDHATSLTTKIYYTLKRLASPKKGKNLTKIISDEELIKKTKNGEESAENLLFSRYKDLVVKIARGYFIVGGDLEDLVQEGIDRKSVV